MSDPQQPGATGDQIPPIPPAPAAPAADVPPVPAAPAADAAPAAPVAPDAAVPPVPPVAPEVPAAPAAPVADAAPVNPYAQAPANPYTAQPEAAQNPYAAQPQAQANPYAAQPQAAQNPYAAQPQQANPYAAPGAPAYVGAPAGPSRLNVMGLISLIAGGVAFLFGVSVGWIPYVGFAFVLIALVGVALGIVGLLTKNKGKGLAIAGTIVSGIALLLTAVISIFMLIVVSSIQSTIDDFDDFGPDAPVITDPDGGESQSDTDEDPNALGSINNPASPGDTITFTDIDGVDEWKVVVGTPVLDATDLIMAYQSYNEAPEPGSQYVVVPVTFTYVGATSDYPYMVLGGLAASDGVIYDTAVVVYENPQYSAPELTSGGSADVNLVFEVPTDAVAGSKLQLSSIWGNDIYVALD